MATPSASSIQSELTRTTPHRQSPRRAETPPTYCVEEEVLEAFVRAAMILRSKGIEVFSVEAAAAHYTLDSYLTGRKSKADYARIWGWTPMQLRARWGDVTGIALQPGGAK